MFNTEKKTIETKSLNYKNSLIECRLVLEKTTCSAIPLMKEEKRIICIITTNKNILSLGECNDGSKFTSVNQAINQAKSFINSSTIHN